MIFLDTNVVSETMRVTPDPAVMTWYEQHGDDAAIATIVLAEILFGIERIRPAKRAKRFDVAIAGLRVAFASRFFAFDEQSALIYAETMGKAARMGQPRPPIDGMIAAVALRHNAVLATRNVKDFEALGVKTVNPWN